MASVEAVQGVSQQGRDLRSDLALPVLQSYELVRFYTIQEVTLIQPIAVREEGLQRTVPADLEPAPIGALPWLPLTTEPVVAAPARREVEPSARPERCDEFHSAEAVCETCVSERAGSGADMRVEETPEKHGSTASKPDVLPYGADIARIQTLVEHIVTGREVVPFTFHYRQAGDLLEVQSPAARPAVSARQVAAVYRAF